MEAPLRQAVQGALNKAQRTRRPRPNEIDWHATIRRNMKHYQPNHQTIIPEVLLGHGRRQRTLKTLILLVDQSGSMAESVVYAGVIAAVMASLRSVKTHIILFDTTVVDMTDKIHDPVELLFAAQLGGGTDIAQALIYAEQLVTQPRDTICLLISDLYEGGNVQVMHQSAQRMVQNGVNMVTLLALSDGGTPAYDHQNAQAFGAIGIPAFACTPDRFPELMAAVLKGERVERFGGY